MPKLKQNPFVDLTGNRDRCQTPPYAVDYLLEHVQLPAGPVWEPAAGEGFISKRLAERGYDVISTDVHPYAAHLVEVETPVDFYFSTRQASSIVTNPPYSWKPKWLRRCYALGLPFALLMPVAFLATDGAIRQFERHGVEILVPDKRIAFKMPEQGWDGSGAQFATCWYTWRLGLGTPLKFARIKRRELPKAIEDLPMFSMNGDAHE